MRDTDRNLNVLLWSVIGVLIVGATVGGGLLVHHASALEKANSQLSGDNVSLKRQVTEARAALAASPTPQPDPLPAATANQATPTPTPKH